VPSRGEDLAPLSRASKECRLAVFIWATAGRRVARRQLTDRNLLFAAPPNILYAARVCGCTKGRLSAREDCHPAGFRNPRSVLVPSTDPSSPARLTERRRCRQAFSAALTPITCHPSISAKRCHFASTGVQYSTISKTGYPVFYGFYLSKRLRWGKQKAEVESGG
jgi:hypothetical protein